MKISYGGDYNPEQWDQEKWEEDIELMVSTNVNLVTLGVFSWARLEPSEGVFEFGWLDDILGRLDAAGIKVDLATATASPPPWLSRRYPETLPVNDQGVTLTTGSRQHYCPSSPIYRRHARELTRMMVDRYGGHPAVSMWHVNNEFGCHTSRCFCEQSARSFRTWLEAKYTTVAALNESWGTSFWSQSYASFDEISVPGATPTWKNPSQLLDFERFSSDELLACYLNEANVIRESYPDAQVTTNFMGLFKGADYWSWAPHLSIISDDNYPDPHDVGGAAAAAMSRDLMRSLKSGQSWMLMEQAASAISWLPVNARKPPQQMRALSYQAIARGSDSVMYFQWRQSERGAERFLTGMLPHTGTRSTSWRAVQTLGNELGALDAMVTAPVPARVAMVFDWESWWSLEEDANPANLDYLREVTQWHRALFDMGITVDFIQAGAVPEGYDVVIVPTLFVASDGELKALDDYVRGGGQLLVTYLSGTTDRTARVRQDGYLGPLSQTLGLAIDEFAPMAVDASARYGTAAKLSGDLVGSGFSSVWAETLLIDGADVVATFDDGELPGSPAITRNNVEDGVAWYVATSLDSTLRRRLLKALGLIPVIVRAEDSDATVEYVGRGDVEFVINHDQVARTVTLDLPHSPSVEHVEVDPFGVVCRSRGTAAFGSVGSIST
ncbi:beta-galactosidase [Demequina aurantiaca]|uniref:beta-galactosidase n=1 Tax=Demequina aurantiaca TaxID=676200 RepID=UPI000B258DBB|nr:beta-galactosidase [Demequina aurantiaca]